MIPSVGLAPINHDDTAFSTSLKVAVTAPEPMPSISAATEGMHGRAGCSDRRCCCGIVCGISF